MSHFVSRPIFTTPTLLTTYTFYLYTFRFYAHTFTSYAKDGFDDAEQIRLRDFCTQIAEHKSMFVASNSDPQNVDNGDDFFDRLYKRFSIKRVSASRMINSNANGRGAVSELMISNVTNAY